MSATADSTGPTEAPLRAEPGSAGRTLRRFLRQRLAMVALVFVALLILVALLAPVLAPYGETEQNLSERFQGMTSAHPLGTDDLGRDTLSRLMYGARVTLQAAFQAVFLAAVVGIAIGLFVGYRGGWADRILMRFVDLGDALPGILLAFAVIAVLGRGLTTAMIAVALIFVTSYVRLTRALVLEQREQLYVDAAKVSGLRTTNVLGRQLLPNIATPLVVQTAIFAGRAVLIEAALSFLGLGLDVSQASWGGMLSNATSNAGVQPLLPWPPGLAITFTVLAFNLIGDGLRDALGGERAVTREGPPARGPRSLGAARNGTGGERTGTHSADAVLAVRDLEVRFARPHGEPLTILEEVSFELRPGETIGLVGESGSGKTMTGLALMGLVPPPGSLTRGSVTLAGRELTALSEAELERVRGDEIAMIFQDPLVALSPAHTVGRQLVQSLRNHRELSVAEARTKAVELLELVGVMNAGARLRDYPHQFSGGMAQRVVIAMALASEPKVMVADEPTTALDVTVQQQVLDLISDLQERLGMAVLLITHDIGVVADSCERALVMYAGQVVEEGMVDDVFARPRHPYTSALLQATPVNAPRGSLPTIEGRVPPPWEWPSGCRFHRRCRYAEPRCTEPPVPLEGGVRCVRQHELELPGTRVELPS